MPAWLCFVVITPLGFAHLCPHASQLATLAAACMQEVLDVLFSQVLDSGAQLSVGQLTRRKQTIIELNTLATQRHGIAVVLNLRL